MNYNEIKSFGWYYCFNYNEEVFVVGKNWKETNHGNFGTEKYGN